MLHSRSFNEHFDDPIPDNEEQTEDQEEEEDNNIQGPTELQPKICPHCKKYDINFLKYHSKDAKNNVWYCENCGYLCKICKEFLPNPSKFSRKTVIECINKHKLYS